MNESTISFDHWLEKNSEDLAELYEELSTVEHQLPYDEWLDRQYEKEILDNEEVQ